MKDSENGVSALVEECIKLRYADRIEALTAERDKAIQGLIDYRESRVYFQRDGLPQFYYGPTGVQRGNYIEVDDMSAEAVKLGKQLQEVIELNETTEINFNNFKSKHRIVSFLWSRWQSKQDV